ncbi:DUF4352 domain-containing protein [Nonomuraea sp. NPDC055795]
MTLHSGEMPTVHGLPQQPFGPPQHAGHAYGAPPPVQPGKRKHAFIVFCLGVAVGVLGVLGVMVVMDGYGPFARQAEMRELVTVGDFRIVVTAVERQGPVAGMPSELIPQGEFVLVRLSVQNIDSSAQTFAVASQKLRAGGAEYDSVRVRETGRMFERIPPGGTTEGLLAFDVPEGAPLDAVELQGGAFSWGTTVKLRER